MQWNHGIDWFSNSARWCLAGSRWTGWTTWAIYAVRCCNTHTQNGACACTHTHTHTHTQSSSTVSNIMIFFFFLQSPWYSCHGQLFPSFLCFSFYALSCIKPDNWMKQHAFQAGRWTACVTIFNCPATHSVFKGWPCMCWICVCSNNVMAATACS